ncbi:MAG: radical SAM protein [Elusimicrobia bacterium]|nr:radical SAM protein [Elusimicrobiota bacterium]
MRNELIGHPCFDSRYQHTVGRIHLPVAAECNIQCRFCNRRYDCVNETRPGVTSVILSPRQALGYLCRAVELQPELKVTGIAGPGDPFATPELTLETLRLIREKFPEMILCVATNGFNLLPYIKELSILKVSHVTVTVNALDEKIGAKIYSRVHYGTRIFLGEEAAKMLAEKQLIAIRELKKAGIIVKINSIILPGINDKHIPVIAVKMAELGVDIMNCLPLYSVKGTEFEDAVPPSDEELKALKEKVSEFLPQMHYCTRCRADAAGLLANSNTANLRECLKQSSLLPINPEEDRPFVAVASREGLLVNCHLGEAEELLIMEKKNEEYYLVEKRLTLESGGGDARWIALGNMLKDCRALLVSGAGPAPQKVLLKQGLKVVLMEGLIKDGLAAVYEGKDLSKLQRSWKGCGLGCSGTGQGCG